MKKFRIYEIDFRGKFTRKGPNWTHWRYNVPGVFTEDQIDSFPKFPETLRTRLRSLCPGTKISLGNESRNTRLVVMVEGSEEVKTRQELRQERSFLISQIEELDAKRARLVQSVAQIERTMNHPITRF